MYAILHHYTVRRGLFQGFRCAVSGKEFVAMNPGKAKVAALYQAQQSHSAALYFLQDNGEPNANRSLESRRQLYAGEHGSAREGN